MQLNPWRWVAYWVSTTAVAALDVIADACDLVAAAILRLEARP